MKIITTSKEYEKPQNKSIDFYPNKGYVTNSPLRYCQPNKVYKRAKRKKIIDFTSPSRRRMRMFLVKNSSPTGWIVFGLTLTIPGYPILPYEMKRLFKLFRTYSQRLDFEFNAVYRLELQERDQPHWHLIVGADCADFGFKKIHSTMLDLWLKCLKALGQCEKKHCGTFKTPELLSESKFILALSLKTGLSVPDDFGFYDYWDSVNSFYGGFWESKDVGNGQEKVVWNKNGSSIEKYSCKCKFFARGYADWMHYLQDHATKLKQAQIAYGYGKHWGVINRKSFVPAECIHTDLTDKQNAAFYRWQHRLGTPINEDDTGVKGWLFNRKKGVNYFARTSQGSKVRFVGSFETQKRMVDYAKENILDTSECMQVMQVRNKTAF